MDDTGNGAGKRHQSDAPNGPETKRDLSPPMASSLPPPSSLLEYVDDMHATRADASFEELLSGIDAAPEPSLKTVMKALLRVGVSVERIAVSMDELASELRGATANAGERIVELEKNVEEINQSRRELANGTTGYAG